MRTLTLLLLGLLLGPVTGCGPVDLAEDEWLPAAAGLAGGKADDPSQRAVWFAHASDLHFGQGPSINSTLDTFFATTVPTIAPTSTVLSGDLVTYGGKDAAAWDAYVLHTAKAPAYPELLEIPGNHDLKYAGKTSYLGHTRSGLATGSLYGATTVSTAVGKVQVIRTNTADGTKDGELSAGTFSLAQQKALLALPPSAAVHTIVAGHHSLLGAKPLSLAGSGTRMQALLDAKGAEVYLCGHIHDVALGWAHETLVVQAASLGASKPASFMLVSLDPTGPAAKTVTATAAPSAWPVTMITAPASATLGGTNPHAVVHHPGESLVVRALAFAAKGITSVEARLDGGAWAKLSPLALAKGQWTGSVTLSAAVGSRTLEVRATSPEGTRSDSVVISVAK